MRRIFSPPSKLNATTCHGGEQLRESRPAAVARPNGWLGRNITCYSREVRPGRLTSWRPWEDKRPADPGIVQNGRFMRRRRSGETETFSGDSVLLRLSCLSSLSLLAGCGIAMIFFWLSHVQPVSAGRRSPSGRASDAETPKDIRRRILTRTTNHFRSDKRRSISAIVAPGRLR